ncbi:hypothetical protein V1477_001405 [Vespula maculifrons]|uniref:Uncharacterized protein n=1 Tax=Vespula maculifrons TaxID=7453 RepID=A0ABD2CZ76_VESMC
MIKASYTIKVFIVLRDNSVSPDTLLNYALICSVRLSQRVIVIPEEVFGSIFTFIQSEYSRHHFPNVLLG